MDNQLHAQFASYGLAVHWLAILPLLAWNAICSVAVQGTHLLSLSLCRHLRTLILTVQKILVAFSGYPLFAYSVLESI